MGSTGSMERGGSIIGRIAQGSLITAGHTTVIMGTTLTATTPSRRIPLRSVIVHRRRRIVPLTTGHLTTDRLLTGLMTVLLAKKSLPLISLLIVDPRITVLLVTMSLLLTGLLTTDLQAMTALLMAPLTIVDHHHPTTKTTVSHRHHHITTTDLLLTICLTP